MRYANWHGLEAVLALAAVGLIVARVTVRRFVTRVWAAPMCLGAAVVCVAGSFTSILGYRPPWDVWCWVITGLVWLIDMGAVRRRQRRAAARARANLLRWEQWQKAQRDNGWTP